MAGSDFTTIADLVKQVYTKDAIEDLQNSAADTWSKIQKSDKKPNGEGLFGGALAAGNQRGLGAQNELEALRTPGHQVPEKYRIRPKIVTQICRVSGLALDVAKGNEDSFADNQTLEMDEGLKDAAKECNAQLFRDGSGKIAQVNGAISGATSLVFDHGVPTHFRVGMFIDVINSGTKEIDSVEVTDVDYSTNTLTLGTSSTCTDDMWIYREDVADNAPTDGKELSGFPRITDDGTDFASYENVVRSGSGYVSAWKGLEIAAGGVNLSDDLLQQGVARGKIYAGAKYDTIVSNTSQFRKYIALTLPSVQHDAGKKRDSGAGKGVEADSVWQGKKWVIDTDCPFDEIIMYSSEYVKRYDVRDLKFDDTDGKIIKWDSGYDAWIMFAKYYGDVGTNNPRKAALRFTGLATPTF